MIINALVNPRSGSVPPNAVALLGEELSRYSKDFSIFDVSQIPLEMACDQIKASPADLLIIWGGDGTISFSLSHCIRPDMPSLILPGGTMNLLPQRLYGQETNWKQILAQTLTSGKRRWISAIEIADQRAYVGILIGKMTGLALSREHVRDGNLIGAFDTLAGADLLDLGTVLDLKLDGMTVRATTAGLFVPEKSGDPMHIFTIDPAGLGELAQIGLSGLIGDWREAEGVLESETRSLSLSLVEGVAIAATIDGEPCEIPMPQTVELIEKACLVMGTEPE